MTTYICNVIIAGNNTVTPSIKMQSTLQSGIVFIPTLPAVLISKFDKGDNTVALSTSSTIKLVSTQMQNDNKVSYNPRSVRPSTNQMWPRYN